MTLENADEIAKVDLESAFQLEDRMSIDYEIARIIIDEILPYSLEYYLGVEGLKETGEAEEARVEKEDKITNLLS